LEVHGTSLTAPYEIPDTFSKHFQSFHSNHSPGYFYCQLFYGCIIFSFRFRFGFSYAIKRLRSSNSVLLDGIPSFVIKGCSEVFIPFLKFICNLSLTQQKYPALWKQAALVPAFQSTCASVINYRSISILNNISKVFEFIVHGHVSRYFKHKLNPCQHSFTKSKCTVTNLVTYLDFVTHLVCSQREVGAVYFDFSSALDLVAHALLHHKLTAAG
jgi:hypothetical protein